MTAPPLLAVWKGTKQPVSAALVKSRENALHSLCEALFICVTLENPTLSQKQEFVHRRSERKENQ